MVFLTWLMIRCQVKSPSLKPRKLHPFPVLHKITQVTMRFLSFFHFFPFWIFLPALDTRLRYFGSCKPTNLSKVFYERLTVTLRCIFLNVPLLPFQSLLWEAYCSTEMCFSQCTTVTLNIWLLAMLSIKTAKIKICNLIHWSGRVSVHSSLFSLTWLCNNTISVKFNWPTGKKFPLIKPVTLCANFYTCSGAPKTNCSTIGLLFDLSWLLILINFMLQEYSFQHYQH